MSVERKVKQYLVVVSFIDGRNQRYLNKTKHMSQVTEKLDHIKLYRVHRTTGGNLNFLFKSQNDQRGI